MLRWLRGGNWYVEVYDGSALYPHTRTLVARIGRDSAKHILPVLPKQGEWIQVKVEVIDKPTELECPKCFQTDVVMCVRCQETFQLANAKEGIIYPND